MVNYLIKAFVLLVLEMGATKEIFEKIKKLPFIESIAVVTGIYDVIIEVRVESLDQLYELTYQDFVAIKGIKEMTTFIVEKEILLDEG